MMAIEPEGKWMANLYGKIGKFRATNGAILPLLAHREVIALLYGDNPETGREVKRMDALPLFVDQAGLGLGNLFLQPKGRSLGGGAVPQRRAYAGRRGGQGAQPQRKHCPSG